MKLIELNPKWVSSIENEHAAIEINCPCGCGDKCLIPCEKGYGNQWHIQNENFDFNTLTLTPSIQRTINPSMCKTHFHITNGEITP